MREIERVLEPALLRHFGDFRLRLVIDLVSEIIGMHPGILMDRADNTILLVDALGAKAQVPGQTDPVVRARPGSELMNKGNQQMPLVNIVLQRIKMERISRNLHGAFDFGEEEGLVEDVLHNLVAHNQIKKIFGKGPLLGRLQQPQPIAPAGFRIGTLKQGDGFPEVSSGLDLGIINIDSEELKVDMGMLERQFLHQCAEHDAVAAAHIKNAQGGLAGYGETVLDDGIDNRIKMQVRDTGKTLS